MPPADQYKHNLLRVLCYGKEKTRKTWWAIKAAEAGFNVHLLDADDGAGINETWKTLDKPSIEAVRRLNIIRVVDKLDVAQTAIFFTSLFANKYIVWDEDDRSIRTVPESIIDTHAHYTIDPRKFNFRDIIIADSWTSLAQSVDEKFAKELGVDITSAEKSGEELYGKDYKFLNWMLNQFNALPCHLIVIGHEQNWQQVKAKTVGGKVVRENVGNPKIQPISSSGRHSGMIGKHFSDILYFSLTPTGHTRINTKNDPDRTGGSRHVPPGEYSWFNDGKDKQIPDQLQFRDLLRYAGIEPIVSPEPSEAVHWCAPGVAPEFATSPGKSGNKLVLGSSGSSIQISATASVGIPTIKPATAPAGSGNTLSGLFGKTNK